MAQKRKPNVVIKKAENATAVKTEPTKIATKPKSQSSNASFFLFDKRNYILMLIGIGFIILGFILMAGGGSKDPNVFNPDIFSPRRITVAPILILLGYAIEVAAIMLKPKQKSSE